MISLIGVGILGYYFSEINSENNNQLDTINTVTVSPEDEAEFASDEEEEEEAAPHDILLGKFTLEELDSGTNGNWFKQNYKNALLDEQVVGKIQNNLQNKNLSMRVFMGTWCADSQKEVPALIKILEQVNFDKSNVTLEGVDEHKTFQHLSEEEIKSLDVYNVPTIIIYDAVGNELNRFVEFPQETLEKDLLKIVSGQDYKHVYDF